MSIIESAKESSRQRLRPILMTSFAFVFGVLPMARATGAGAYSRNSLGIVIAFGIAVSTVLGRFVIPIYYVLGERLIGQPDRPARPGRPTPADGGGRASGVRSPRIGARRGESTAVRSWLRYFPPSSPFCLFDNPEDCTRDPQRHSRPVPRPAGKSVRLKDYNPGWDQTEEMQELGKDALRSGRRQILDQNLADLAEAQDLLYADDRYSVLIVLQAMDAAGKDGTIKHVMSGVNPQGCQVFSFKKPRPRSWTTTSSGGTCGACRSAGGSGSSTARTTRTCWS